MGLGYLAYSLKDEKYLTSLVGKYRELIEAETNIRQSKKSTKM